MRNIAIAFGEISAAKMLSLLIIGDIWFIKTPSNINAFNELTSQGVLGEVLGSVSFFNADSSFSDVLFDVLDHHSSNSWDGPFSGHWSEIRVIGRARHEVIRAVAEYDSIFAVGDGEDCLIRHSEMTS